MLTSVGVNGSPLVGPGGVPVRFLGLPASYGIRYWKTDLRGIVCGLCFYGPVDVLLQSGDMRDSCTGGYFDPTSVQWCTGGDCRLVADIWLLIISALIATARVHFTYTSGLIPRRRVFFSGKVVVHPTHEPSDWVRLDFSSG
uniref:Uncharacterized protein n=1 Tax=Ananas comosus var. bracteatus TaxID=296719 RepID=A0A6V7NHI3_ANACO|nr:unnamed protein product [Ananas comosus var. bracteatus]